MRLCIPVLLLVVHLRLLAQTPPAPAEDPLGRSTPRGTVVRFLLTVRDGNLTAATRYLESGANAATPEYQTARELARQLKAVLDRRLNILPAAISDDPEGNLADGLPPDREEVGAILTAAGSVPVRLVRVPLADSGARVWLFSGETLQAIPAVYRTLSPLLIERYLPDILVTRQFLGLAAWRWIALLLLVPAAIGLAYLISALVIRTLDAVTGRTPTEADDGIVSMLRGPLRLFVSIAVFHAAIALLELPLLMRQAIGTLELILVAVAFSWFMLRVIDFGADQAKLALVRSHRVSATAVVPLGRRILKVVLVAIVILAALDNAGFEMKTVLAGLGVGGIAVALAAQKTLENLFAGISLVVDQPVRVGDFCKYGDSVGTVEDIGLRSTRVRSLDRTVVTVPNSQFATVNLENFARREKVWFHPTLALRLDTTPDQLRYVLAAIRRLLYEHPLVEDGSRIRLVGFGPDSLKLEVFAYVLTPDYTEFVAIQEDLLLRMLEVVSDAGTSLATPTQTTFLARDRGLNPEKAGAAVEEVARWKQQRKLPFPDYSPEEVRQMRNRLPYPPSESALRDGST